MSLTIAARGRHTAAHLIGQLRGQLRDLEGDNALLVRDGQEMATEIHTALIRGCQDAMRIAVLVGGYDQAVTDLSAALDDLRKAQDELAELRAFKANHEAVTVPLMQRDVSDGADQATEPINVRPLWQALNLGPTAATTNPGRLPCSWGVKDPEPEPAA